VALDFRETAPIGIHPEHYDARPVSAPRRGVLVGVPGEVAGLAQLHRRWGKLPFATLAGRAAEIADRGFEVSPHLSRALRWNASWVLQTPAVAAAFAPLGELLGSGARAKNPRLGRTLERIGAEGSAAFYQGAIGTDVVDTARRAGSRIAATDLTSYQVVERTPLELEWHGHRVLTMPPPSGGGLALAETLGMHTPDELRALGYGSGAYGHVLCETFRLALGDRVRAIGDPGFIRPNLPCVLASPSTGRCLRPACPSPTRARPPCWSSTPRATWWR
jgi:gamma-glutamyltranspeptidase/glutathione hydrolase